MTGSPVLVFVVFVFRKLRGEGGVDGMDAEMRKGGGHEGRLGEGGGGGDEGRRGGQREEEALVEGVDGGIRGVGEVRVVEGERKR